MLRSIAIVLAVALLAASRPPGDGRSPGRAAPDRVAELAGTWTCRDPAGALSTVTYRAERGGVAATETDAAGAVTANDVFTPSSSGWSVERTAKYGTFSGYASAWTTGPWIVTESQKHGAEIRYERIDDRTLRRTFHISGRAPYAGEVCARGSAPPDPALCAVPDIPALVVRAMFPDTPAAAEGSHLSASVDVLVSLDAAGHVVNATVERSGAAVLDGSALAAARGSTYQPALHDCKPAASTYLFKVDYNAQ
jgi:TonB family protein